MHNIKDMPNMLQRYGPRDPALYSIKSHSENNESVSSIFLNQILKSNALYNLHMGIIHVQYSLQYQNPASILNGCEQTLSTHLQMPQFNQVPKERW